MRTEKDNRFYRYKRQFIIRILVVAFAFLFQKYSNAQTFAVSFPIGNMVCQGSELPLTIVIEGVKCGKTVIKCHKGLLSRVGGCTYVYRCNIIGVDTVEVFIRKGDKLSRIGQQVFEIKPRPKPEATISGLKGGVIKKGALKVQQGVGGYFYISGSHWEPCTIESFTFCILRNARVITSIRNDDNFFNNETKLALQQVLSGDKVLVTDIKGCLQHGGGHLEPLEFTIE